MPKGRRTPPCPDPLLYVLVKSSEGYYWRRKRGTVKKAVLNEAFALNAANTGSGPAKQVADKLFPYLEHMKPGRQIARMGALFRRAKTRTGAYDFSLFKGFEIQKKLPLDRILKSNFTIRVQKGMMYISIPLKRFDVMKPVKYVKRFNLEAILLYGHPDKKNSIRTESDVSPMYLLDLPEYLVNSPVHEDCVLTLQLPEKLPWIVFLKVGVHEANTLGYYGGLYGMAVVETSFDVKGE